VLLCIKTLSFATLSFFAVLCVFALRVCYGWMQDTSRKDAKDRKVANILVQRITRVDSIIPI